MAKAGNSPSSGVACFNEENANPVEVEMNNPQPIPKPGINIGIVTRKL